MRRLVYIWDSVTRQVIYKLPGHTGVYYTALSHSLPCLPFALTIVCLVCVRASSGTVNEVAFHPDEPIIASCSSDKKIYLGEIEP